VSSGAIVELIGSFDIFERDELNAAFSGVASEPFVVLDLRSVTYADSTILSEIVQLHRLLAAGKGRLVLVEASSMIRRLLNITGLDRMLDIRASLADVEREHTLVDARRLMIKTKQTDPPRRAD
jgi:anti-sigma B factor antagonist